MHNRLPHAGGEMISRRIYQVGSDQSYVPKMLAERSDPFFDVPAGTLGNGNLIDGAVKDARQGGRGVRLV